MNRLDTAEIIIMTDLTVHRWITHSIMMMPDGPASADNFVNQSVQLPLRRWQQCLNTKGKQSTADCAPWAKPKQTKYLYTQTTISRLATLPPSMCIGDRAVYFDRCSYIARKHQINDADDTSLRPQLSCSDDVDSVENWGQSNATPHVRETLGDR